MNKFVFPKKIIILFLRLWFGPSAASELYDMMKLLRLIVY